ncbi:hypothetical protein JYQ62_07930 [Nostoc sp. UHCC 0702]|nr:hypothetical protein JYQ62_07930 [Nostoc sp. UHCC 0702]
MVQLRTELVLVVKNLKPPLVTLVPTLPFRASAVPHGELLRCPGSPAAAQVAWKPPLNDCLTKDTKTQSVLF